MVKDDEVWTSTGQYCMNGITRHNIIRVCRENNIPVHEKNFSLFDVYGANEAFVTGTFGGVTPVVEIDGRTIGDGSMGPVSQRLSELYNTLIQHEAGHSKNES